MNATLQTYVTQVQRLLHDVTYSVWTIAELTDYINEARDDVSLDMHCNRHLKTQVQLLPGQEIYLIDGAVTGVYMKTGGSNYSPATTVTFDPPSSEPNAMQATGVPIVNPDGSIGGVQMTQWGRRYASGPLVTFSDVTGTGARADAAILMNAFQIISISNIWNNQRYSLSFRGFTLFQAYFRFQPVAYTARPGVWTFHPQDLAVYIQSPPDQLYTSEWDVLETTFPLVNLSDEDREIVPPWNKAVQFRAAAIALMKKQNFAQSDYYERKYAERVPRYIIGAAGIRIPNPYNRNFQRKVSRGV
jgi:hypothetical protein